MSRIVKPDGGTVGAGVPDGPQVHLTSYGQTVEDVLFQINRQYPHINLDRYVIMPNHIHLLIRITEDGSSRTPTPTNATIPALVSTMKRMTNRQCGEKLWQRSFHDHIIRGEDDYRQIAEYIEANPARWAEDRFHSKT